MMGKNSFLVSPVGAHINRDAGIRGVDYRVWAPGLDQIHTIVLADDNERRLPMVKEDGFHFVNDPDGRAGDLYWLELPDGTRVPDVASRYQPRGVHGPSEVIDPGAYAWKTPDWQRPSIRDQVIYEVHIGTFTPEGTFLSAIERLDHIAALGATAVELMPVADFPGRFNWGYDGAALYAPARCYGRPNDLRAFVDAAHARGLAVILDVVYNHVGPEGSYLQRFCPDYFHHERETAWGTGYNLDLEPVREFILQNIAYWLDDFRFDGLRVDATHAIIDNSDLHLLAEIADTAHSRGAFVIAEDERNSVELLCRADGTGHGFDAAWSDDFHHSVRVALTGTRESYFKAYEGTPAELEKTLHSGWTYCGEPFAFWQGRPRGSDCQHLHPSAFVFCIENHDQVGNRAHGERLEHLVTVDKFHAASTLLCLSPYTPMIFMGQEWRASTPFLFFSDLSGKDGQLVRARRIEEFEKTGLNADPSSRDSMPDPQDPGTFAMSILDWAEAVQPAHTDSLRLYKECLQWRRLRLQGQATERAFWNVVLQSGTVAVRYQPPDAEEWMLAVNLRGTGTLSYTDRLAPPKRRAWETVFHTAQTRFGGNASLTIPERFRAGDILTIPAPIAVVLQASHAL